MSNELGEALGQPVIVMNRAGATGAIGAEAVARSKPDGYTLIFGTAATHALNVSVFKSLPYHPLKDFAPVAFVGSVPVILYAHPSMPSQPRDFIEKLKANPKKIFYGSAGMSTSYLGIELFLNMAKVSASQVPYKAPARPCRAWSVARCSSVARHSARAVNSSRRGSCTPSPS
ncbi:hypothetical protein LP414_32160 [Polaromonas sp. P1(28)-13]|nr:hypothetical protein LP414_32160 [Polaromonas sp. P1(28)-13]